MRKKENQIDELIRLALLAEQQIPEGACERLEGQIGRWEAEEKYTHRFSFFRDIRYRIGAAVALLLLCVGFFRFQTREASLLVDTYTDPKEALVATEKALLLLSQNLNKGIDQVDTAGKEIGRMNDILNKQLKIKELK